MKEIVILLLVTALSSSQGCPGFYSEDLLQSGKHVFGNSPLAQSTNLDYQARVFIKAPTTGLQVATTLSGITGQDLNDGFNFQVTGSPNEFNTFVIFNVNTGGSWRSLQISYLISGREDLALGNFQAQLRDTTIGEGNYEASHQIARQFRDSKYKQYKVAAFISGFSHNSPVFSYTNTKAYMHHGSRSVVIEFDSTQESGMITFSFIVYPDSHRVLTISYETIPMRDGSYFLTGPSSVSSQQNINYQQWRVQNRFLLCRDSKCPSLCVRSEECIESQGNVWQGRCSHCLPGVKFDHGRCTRQCGQNQYYYYGVCYCYPSYVRDGQDCYPQKQCDSDIGLVQKGKDCVCKTGFAYFRNLFCRQCPSGSEVSEDGSTCVCNQGIFNEQDYQCNQCHSSMISVKGSCQCKSDYVPYGEICRLCEVGSTINDQGTSCKCKIQNMIYFPDVNQCGLCPHNAITKLDNSGCVCLNGQKLVGMICQKECTANEKLLNGECIPICEEPNSGPVDGTCQCLPGFQKKQEGGQCQSICGTNQVWNYGCECSPKFVKMNGLCQMCPANTVPNGLQNSCICLGVGLVLGDFACESCSGNKSLNARGNKCVCNPGFSGDQCLLQRNCPLNSSWNSSTLLCECTDPLVLIKGQCKTCMQEEEFNGTDCVCKDGYFKVNGFCRRCPERSYSNGTSCICFWGYYLDGNFCLECDKSCGRCTGNQAHQCTFCADVSLVLRNGFCTVPQGPCPRGFFLDQASCRPCPPPALECDGQYKSTKCPNGFEVKTKIIFGYTVDKCEEVCGDGVRSRQMCDDGGKVNGDGCSDDCKIEEGWYCAGGSSIKPDRCFKIPTVRQPIIVKQRGTIDAGNRVLQTLYTPYLPSCITRNNCQFCHQALEVKVIDQSQLVDNPTSFAPTPSTYIKVAVNYVPYSKYRFYIEYKFNREVLSSNFRVKIKLNEKFRQCLSLSDMNRVVTMEIDPSDYLCPEPIRTLVLNREELEQIQIQDSCKQQMYHVFLP